MHQQLGQCHQVLWHGLPNDLAITPPFHYLGSGIWFSFFFVLLIYLFCIVSWDMHNWNIYLSIFSSILIIISFVHMYKNIQGKSYFDFFFFYNLRWPIPSQKAFYYYKYFLIKYILNFFVGYDGALWHHPLSQIGFKDGGTTTISHRLRWLVMGNVSQFCNVVELILKLIVARLFRIKFMTISSHVAIHLQWY